MNASRLQGSWSMLPLSRRQLLSGAVGLAGLSALGWRSLPVSAQELNGEIVVQFESRGGVLETEVNEVIAAITAANPGAKITIAPAVAGDYMTEVLLALQSGEGPDVFAMNSIAIAQLGDSGMVAPLGERATGWEEWEQFIPAYKQYLPFAGEVWALPYSIDTHFLYHRVELFEAAGLTMPWQPATLDDLLGAARALKATMPEDGVPYVLYAGANAGNSTAVRGFLPILYANGGRLKNDEGKWIIDSQAIRDTFAFYELVYQTEQLVPQSVISTPNVATQMRRAFAMGNVGILFDGCWVWDDWTAVVPPEKIGYTLHPANGREPFTIGGFGNGWFMNAQTQSPDLAWAFSAGVLGVGPVTRINADDPHVPPRADAAADPAFDDPFMRAMVDSIETAVMISPEPEFGALVEIIQNATGSVATGDVKPGDAADKYRDELERVLGVENTVSEL